MNARVIGRRIRVWRRSTGRPWRQSRGVSGWSRPDGGRAAVRAGCEVPAAGLECVCRPVGRVSRARRHILLRYSPHCGRCSARRWCFRRVLVLCCRRGGLHSGSRCSGSRVGYHRSMSAALTSRPVGVAVQCTMISLIFLMIADCFEYPAKIAEAPEGFYHICARRKKNTCRSMVALRHVSQCVVSAIRLSLSFS